jgi:2-isopropylmalate synthase
VSNTKIIDATLREGKQSIRRELSNTSMLHIAEKIVSLGVDQLEVGHAAISEKEIALLKSIKKNFPQVPLMTHSRAMPSDVQKAIDAGVDWIGIFISTNDYARFRINNFSVEKIIKRVQRSVELAKANHLKVRFTLEDSSRTDSSLMSKVFESAIHWGADRICLADTLGILEPKEVANIVQLLVNRYTTVPLEVHFHNDRGLAMANTLQAIESGATWISSSVNGIGERAGITDTCLLLANLYYKGGYKLPKTANIKQVSDFVAQKMGVSVDEHRPVVGTKAFAHVADLHVKAMEKNTFSYNWVQPELFGQQTTLIKKVSPTRVLVTNH